MVIVYHWICHWIFSWGFPDKWSLLMLLYLFPLVTLVMTSGCPSNVQELFEGDLLPGTDSPPQSCIQLRHNQG